MFWAGIEFGIGLVVGIWLLIVVPLRARAYYELWLLMSSGCTYQDGSGGPEAPRGWLTRDVTNNDWILWDETSRVVLRCNDDAPGAPWRASNESLRQFLSLSHHYQELWNKK
jgi:hypothetical protein